MKILVTGGCGFIGSAVCRRIIRETGDSVVNLDLLTYAGSPTSVAEVAGSDRYAFVRADIADRAAMEAVFAEHQPDAVMNLAAESHVDRSIETAEPFVRTNVVGTFTVLETALAYWKALPADRKAAFRLLHISTDEVYGSLGDEGLFTETTPYDPRSPYSATCFRCASWACGRCRPSTPACACPAAAAEAEDGAEAGAGDGAAAGAGTAAATATATTTTATTTTTMTTAAAEEEGTTALVAAAVPAPAPRSRSPPPLRAPSPSSARCRTSRSALAAAAAAWPCPSVRL